MGVSGAGAGDEWITTTTPLLSGLVFGFGPLNGRMHDLKFRKAWFPYKDPIVLSRLKSQGIVEVAQTFNQNIRRVHRMTTFLPWILGRGQLQVRALMIAKCTHQRPFEIFDSSIDLESLMGKRIMEMSDSIIKAFNKEDDGYVDRTRQLYQSGGDQLFSAIDHGDNKDIGASAEAVLVSMLVLGWTAIEVCLEDLFAAVIAESKRAAALKGNDLRIVQMQCSSRSVAAPTKARSNVNKPKFSTLQQAREAYARAFDVDSAQVDRALSSLQLDALASHTKLIGSSQWKNGRLISSTIRGDLFTEAIQKPDLQGGQNQWRSDTKMDNWGAKAGCIFGVRC